MLKSYKYRIFPNETQKEQLSQFFGVVRLVYNLGLETKTLAYTGNKKSISNYDLINQLPDLKEEYEWIKDCPAQSLQQSLSNLDTAYNNFFKGRTKFPKFKNKFRKQSIIFPQNFKILFTDNIIRLPKLKEVAIDYHRDFKGIPKRVTLSKTTTEKYFVSILVENNIEIPEKKPINKNTSIGIDFGIKNLAITSEGKIFENKNFFKSQQRRLRIEQRSLTRKVKGSNNREKQKLVVSLLHEKIRNQRIDYLHKISTYLIQNYDTIILEDLGVSNMVKNHKLACAISDMGWRELRTMLEYKCNWYGKNNITIGRFEPSSKMCSSCGFIKSDLKLSDRTYHCNKCDFESDRDLNASINIRNIGLGNQPLSVNVMH